MSARDEIRAINAEAADDEEIVAMTGELDIAESLAIFTNTPAGKDTIKKLTAVTYGSLNEVFAVANENPEMGKLLSAVMKFQTNLTMLKRFLGAKSDANALLDMLQGKLKEKYGGQGGQG